VNFLSNITRYEGDPKILHTGPSSLSNADRLGKALGWFSIGLGLVELISPRTITRALGMRGKEGLVQAYGAREIGAGVLTLSLEKDLGLWSRVAGDGLDIATLLNAYRPENPKRSNVGLALGMVIGVTLLDLLGASSVAVTHTRGRGTPRDYSNRSGYPKGLAAARGAAKDFRPNDMKAAPVHA
jgi:hypothetical protein